MELDILDLSKTICGRRNGHLYKLIENLEDSEVNRSYVKSIDLYILDLLRSECTTLI